jgi:hypothetical protein
MKNGLAHTLIVLQEALAAQPAIATSWKPGVDIVEEQDTKSKDIVYWIREKMEPPFFDEDALAELKGAGILMNRGVAVAKKLGRSSPLAYGVRMRKLEAEVAKSERGLAQIMDLEDTVKKLQSELKAARSANIGGMAFGRMMDQMTSAYKSKPSKRPQPFKGDRKKPNKSQTLAGVPTLLLSDWHVGETVDPRQVAYVNEYNMEVAWDRAKRVFDKTMELLFLHQAGLTYDGITVAFAGDMLSGNIHEDLRRTNEKPMFEVMMELADLLSDQLVQMNEEFDCVYVPCVVGNHGRMDSKPSYKNSVLENADYLLYRMVEQLVRGKIGSKPNYVEFDISEGCDLNFNIYNTSYVLTHGDTPGKPVNIESGQFWPHMMKTAGKLKERYVSMGAGAPDYMVCGHFHKYGFIPGVIVNGSLKGYDQYGHRNNLDCERAVQALWMTHPELGITKCEAVYASQNISDKTAFAMPITTSKMLESRRMNLLKARASN